MVKSILFGRFEQFPKNLFVMDLMDTVSFLHSYVYRRQWSDVTAGFGNLWSVVRAFLLLWWRSCTPMKDWWHSGHMPLSAASNKFLCCDATGIVVIVVVLFLFLCLMLWLSVLTVLFLLLLLQLRLLYSMMSCLQCAGVKHMNISCESCKQQGILGTRWRCIQCPELSLCDCCYMSDKHDISHPFVRYDSSCSAQSGSVLRMSAVLEIINVALIIYTFRCQTVVDLCVMWSIQYTSAVTVTAVMLWISNFSSVEAPVFLASCTCEQSSSVTWKAIFAAKSLQQICVQIISCSCVRNYCLPMVTVGVLSFCVSVCLGCISSNPKLRNRFAWNFAPRWKSVLDAASHILVAVSPEVRQGSHYFIFIH